MIQDLKQESGILLMITIMEIVRPLLCDYSDAYILVTGNTKV